MKLTPSLVKNLMRRGLRLLVDPEPEAASREEVVLFFNHCCAYCGVSVAGGRGDLDHLLSASAGGRNHISNRVLSCKRCNAEEKRDKDWDQFLLEQHGEGETFLARRARIEEWVASVGAVAPLSEQVLRVLEEQSAIATIAYQEACNKVRGV
jgi:HNH endonuclease